jgi:AcrR family transcriptional regulator
MPRRYEQRARAEASHETQRRILEALYRQLEQAPTAAISVEQVAEAAGVARSTVYVVFGSRRGMFDAFGSYLLERSGFDRIVAAVEHPDARENLRRGIRAGCQGFAAVRDVVRAVYSLGRIDPDTMAGTTRLTEENRAGGMEHLARRLADQGVLRPGVSVAEAADVLWLLTSFDAFDLLYTGRSLPWPDVAERLTATAERTLCRPSGDDPLAQAAPPSAEASTVSSTL